MEISLGGSVRVVTVGDARPQSLYDGPPGPNGRPTASGPKTDASGARLFSAPVTLVSPLAGWVEGTTIVVPEPLVGDFGSRGIVLELSGDLRMAVRGGDFGATRATITGVSGVRAIGSALDALAAVGGGQRRSGGAE